MIVGLANGIAVRTSFPAQTLGGPAPIHTKNTIVLNHEKLYFIFII
jgi:hypothetical protein